MGFENQGNESKKKPIEGVGAGKAALFSAVLVFGAQDAASAEQQNAQAPLGKEAVRQSVPTSPLTGGDIEFLREKFSSFDSSVLRWKASGYVPDSWESLSDADLCALITYVNRVHSSIKIKNILSYDMAFGPNVSSRYLRNFVRSGIREMLEMYKISDEEASTMTWGNLAQKTIYRIPRDQK